MAGLLKQQCPNAKPQVIYFGAFGIEVEKEIRSAKIGVGASLDTAIRRWYGCRICKRSPLAMAHGPLINERQLASASFLRDLTSFLAMPEDVLMAIAESGGGSEGFRGSNLAQDLRRGWGTPLTEAVGALLIAEHLYRRKIDLNISIDDAVEQLAIVASDMEPPIHIDEKHREAIAAVLSFKREYEVSLATSKAVVEGPHYVGANGSWGVKSVPISSGEVVQIPVLSFSIIWHDGAENHHEMFLQMVDRDWEDFTGKINALSDSRGNAIQ